MTKNATGRVMRCISLMPEENDMLASLAKRCGVSVSQLVREALVYQNIELPRPKDIRVHVNQAFGEKRNERICVQVTPSEKEAFELKAGSLGCSVSDLVRRSALEGEINSIEFDLEKLNRVYYELVRQGTNLNQLMHFLNSRGIKGYNTDETASVLALVRNVAEKTDAIVVEVEDEYHLRKGK